MGWKIYFGFMSIMLFLGLISTLIKFIRSPKSAVTVGGLIGSLVGFGLTVPLYVFAYNSIF